MAAVEFQELTAKYTLQNSMELRTKRLYVGGVTGLIGCLSFL